MMSDLIYNNYYVSSPPRENYQPQFKRENGFWDLLTFTKITYSNEFVEIQIFIFFTGKWRNSGFTTEAVKCHFQQFYK